jgi:alpha 1,3-glucosidase
MVESGLLDLFVLLGPTPTEVVRQYVSLTGTAHLPQVFDSLHGILVLIFG